MANFDILASGDCDHFDGFEDKRRKREFKLPAAQGFEHIFQPVSTHLDQNKAGLEKQAKPRSKIISDVFENQNVRKTHLKIRPWFLKTKGSFYLN